MDLSLTPAAQRHAAHFSTSILARMPVHTRACYTCISVCIHASAYYHCCPSPCVHIYIYIVGFFKLKEIFFLNNIFNLITRYVSKVFGNFDMFSSNHVSFMFGSTQMLGHIVLTNHSTTLAKYSSVSFMRHIV
jgi:hypothetical protein